MKPILFSVFFVCFTTMVNAQLPEDVLKYTWTPVNGTARVNGIGGAMGSLGGDITATYTNPAGLAFFKTTEFVLSPGFSFLNTDGSYRGTGSTASKSSFNFGPTGFVGGLANNGAARNRTLSFAVNRTANFSNRISYTGRNDFSSSAEGYASELANSGISIDNASDDNSLSYGTRMAVYNFLIDTASIPGHTGQDVVSLAMLDALKNNGQFLVNQTNTIETSGGITEPALGYAVNLNDKVFIGGSLGLPIVNYTRNSTFREEDATGNNNNDFTYSELSERYTTKGAGFNLKMGLIVKPNDLLRLGLAIHSPSWYALTDSYVGTMTVSLDNYRTTPGATSISSVDLDGDVADYRYNLTTPWKFMGSASYVLGANEDVKQQKGFITGDVEYVTYTSDKFVNNDEYNDQSYYDGVNSTIKDYYKNSVNFRLGGEMKFNTVMARLGFAYYGSPYADADLKANKMFVSGGFGYRNAGIIVDVSYTHGLQKDISFPYRLPDKANTYANLKGNTGGLMVTLGFKI